jgi:hypothetical protein
MNLSKIISSCSNMLSGFGKEFFAIAILVTGIMFRLKGLIDGAQFVDLLKNIGMTYLASHTINSTWGNNVGGQNMPVDDPDKGP